jgi:hypothetical protein
MNELREKLQFQTIAEYNAVILRNIGVVKNGPSLNKSELIYSTSPHVFRS